MSNMTTEEARYRTSVSEAGELAEHYIARIATIKVNHAMEVQQLHNTIEDLSRQLAEARAQIPTEQGDSDGDDTADVHDH